jgi:hypothetical protein
MQRFIALLALVAAVAGLNACDATGVRAQFENVDNPDVLVYALNGTPPSLPSAILLRGAIAIPITSDFNFDLALDLNDTGAVVVHTVKSVASEFVQAHRVGLDTTSRAFGDVTTSVGFKFHYDSSLVVPVGKTVVVDALDPTCSVFSLLGQNIRAKFVVDSVNTAERQIYIHLFVDPNCGFRSLAPGTPRE